MQGLTDLILIELEPQATFFSLPWFLAVHLYDFPPPPPCFLLLTQYLYHFENLENAHTPRPDPSV